MGLKLGRFDDLPGEEAKTILQALEGPLLEIDLAGYSSADIGDIVLEVMFGLHHDRRVQKIFATEDELAAWERFKLEHGEGATEIGEFTYGPDANPWA